MVGVERLSRAQDAEYEVQELGHDRADDDDGFLALVLEPVAEGLADGVVAHGAHGGEEEGFPQPRGAGFAHGSVSRAAGAALPVPWGDSGVGGELARVAKAIKIGKFGEDDGGAELADTFDADEEPVALVEIPVGPDGGKELGLETGNVAFQEADVGFEIALDEGIGGETEPVAFGIMLDLEAVEAAGEGADFELGGAGTVPRIGPLTGAVVGDEPGVRGIGLAALVAAGGVAFDAPGVLNTEAGDFFIEEAGKSISVWAGGFHADVEVAGIDVLLTKPFEERGVAFHGVVEGFFAIGIGLVMSHEGDLEGGLGNVNAEGVAELDFGWIHGLIRVVLFHETCGSGAAGDLTRAMRILARDPGYGSVSNSLQERWGPD